MASSAGADWDRAVRLGARGCYDEAEASAVALLERADRWASLARSMLASHGRQVGDHDAAARLDAAALASATDVESRADALVGLAADAVAVSDVELARRWHGEAEVDAAEAWRTRARWHWVGAELAMLVGEASAGAVHARLALEACAGESPRHEAKSHIILAAATGDLLPLVDVEEIVRSERWVTLAWPLALVVADHPGDADPGWASGVRTEGRSATYAIQAHLSGSRREIWCAHPGVRRLRQEAP